MGLQDAGSRYLWIEEKTTPGLRSHSIFDIDKLFMKSGGNRIYLIWRHDAALPPELSALAVRKTASFEIPNKRFPR
jgi:hypothetical protein